MKKTMTNIKKIPGPATATATATATEIMKRKSTCSYSYIVRRRLMKKRVKAALFKASLEKKKKKKQRKLQLEVVEEEEEEEEPTAFSTPLQPPVNVKEEEEEKKGFLECVFGFFINGEFIQMTRGFLVNVAPGLPPYYFPVVDNHGFLLGEFRNLDDNLSFSIREEEKTPIYFNP